MCPDNPEPVTWTSGGIPRTVETFCTQAESCEQCRARHDAAVASAKVLWPPD